jgi:hypothetical protein
VFSCEYFPHEIFFFLWVGGINKVQLKFCSTFNVSTRDLKQNNCIKKHDPFQDVSKLHKKVHNGKWNFSQSSYERISRVSRSDAQRKKNIWSSDWCMSYIEFMNENIVMRYQHVLLTLLHSHNSGIEYYAMIIVNSLIRTLFSEMF